MSILTLRRLFSYEVVMQKRSFWYRLRRISPVHIIALGFLLVILLGTLLLSLPIAYKGEKIGLLDTCFTATSATCVTGLVVKDTAVHWTMFGQAVILLLIQIGGLGFMSMITLVSFIVRRRITLKEQIVMGEALSGIDLDGVLPLMKRILLGTLIFEASGALLLCTVFIPDFGFGAGLWKSVFISVSAFCNAGFDVMGDTYGAFVGLEPYVNNITVNLTVCALIIMGGLGFLVWGRRPRKRLTLHTRLVLLMTAGLLIAGTVLFYFLEQNNPLTLGNLPFGEKLLAAFFQSVTTRTAGFATVSNGSLTVPSKLVTMLLMFVGGSPGSTAGGIKTVTAAVAIYGAISVLRGCGDVTVFRRSIPKKTVLRAMALTLVAMLVVGISALFMLCVGGASAVDLVFEVFSAFGTVGLGTGITPVLPACSKVLLILLMYAGRVGIMTLAVAVLLDREKIEVLRYAEENVVIG